MKCSICDFQSADRVSCLQCTEEGDTTARFCPSCSAQCPSCSDFYCEDHAHSKTKLCGLCQQRENGPEDYITDDRWQATQ